MIDLIGILEAEMEIVRYGDEILRKKAEPIEKIEEVEGVIDDMFRLMHEAEGVGLAGPQAGISKRFFVIEVDESGPLVFVNPVIIERKGRKTELEEGCLSFPGITGTVVRPETVLIKALDRAGEEFTLETDGLLAKVIQHEYDHINGVLFIDKLQDFEKQTIKDDLKSLRKRTLKRRQSRALSAESRE